MHIMNNIFKGQDQMIMQKSFFPGVKDFLATVDIKVEVTVIKQRFGFFVSNVGVEPYIFITVKDPLNVNSCKFTNSVRKCIQKVTAIFTIMLAY